MKTVPTGGHLVKSQQWCGAGGGGAWKYVFVSQALFRAIREMKIGHLHFIPVAE
jgi:hypothetical protein